MAETHPKRHRDTAADSRIATAKRHKQQHSYINEQNESKKPTDYSSDFSDLSDFFTNIPSESDPFLDFTQNPESDTNGESNQSSQSIEELNQPIEYQSVELNQSIDDDDEKERVIRHLLEASDDELGIPSRVDGGGDGGYGGDEVAGEGFLFDGLWEIEDEAANYYTLLQSELFML